MHHLPATESPRRSVPHRAGRRLLAIAMVSLATLIAPHVALGDRGFSPRFQTNDRGNIAVAANTLETCPPTDGTCAAAQAGAASNNNGYVMQRVDTDLDPTTFDSSSSTLSLPAGAQVLFAGLYWGADVGPGNAVGGVRGTAAPNPTAAGESTVALRAPGAATAVTLNPANTVLDSSATNVARYQGFQDITGIVSAAGNGSYTVANVQAGTGGDVYAGWSIVVAYRLTTDPARNLTVFDGFKSIQSTAAPTSISLTGFQTPPSGPVNTSLGFVSYEGDLGTTGDAASLNGTTLTDANNPASNFFNSTISQFGQTVTTKNPNYVNQLGYDSDLFNANGILANNATSATIGLKTNGDVYFPGVITFATELYAPNIQSTKTVQDVTHPGGPTQPGDVLRYTVGYTNTGQDSATSFISEDQIPAGTTYVPGSLAVTGPNAGAKTDGAGDDQAEYNAGQARVQVRLGTDAGATAGGSIGFAGSASATTSYSFAVRVDDDTPDATTIANQATAAYFARALNSPLTDTTPTASTTVAAPDLTLTKTRTGSLTAGANTTYTLTATDAGALATSGTVTVSDTLPADSFDTVAVSSAPGWTCTVTGLSVSCQRGDALASGASYPPIALTARVSAAPAATITNSAQVTGGGDTNPSNNAATEKGTSNARADLQVTKVATNPTADVLVGTRIGYDVTVTNGGPSPAAAPTLSDSLPAGLTNAAATTDRGSCSITGTTVTCQLGATMPAGAVAHIHIDATATAAANDSTVTNTATASTTTVDPTANNDAASADVVVANTADLQLTKTTSTATPTAGRPGGLQYTLSVHNAGPGAASKVVVTDPLPPQFSATAVDAPGFDCGTGLPAPGATLTCVRTTLASGATATVTITGTIAGDAAGQTIINSASVHTDSGDPDHSSDTATTQVQPTPSADLQMTVQGPASPVDVGATAPFTLTATNNGPSTATGVVVTDTIPSGLEFASADPGCSYDASTRVVTCQAGTLTGGQSRPFTVNLTATAAAAGQTITDSASVTDSTGGANDPIASNNASSATVTVGARADLAITQSASPTSVPVGGQTSFTLTVTNGGPSGADNVTVSDVLPAGLTLLSAAPSQGSCDAAGACSLGSLASGGRATITVVVTVTQPGSLTNMAAVSATTADPNPANNSSSATIQATPSADLSLAKTVDSPVDRGDRAVFTIVATNHGPSAATGVVVRDIAPTGLTVVSSRTDAGTCTGSTCQLGTLASGRSSTITVTASADRDGVSTNRATITSDTPDPNASNDSASASLRVNAVANLSIVKTVDDDTVTPGGLVHFTLTVHNDGPSDAPRVTVTDAPGSGLDPESASASQGSCDDATHCALGTLPSGKTATVTVVARARDAGDAGNTATVASASSTGPVRVPGAIDPSTANNTSSATVDVRPEADLVVTKTASDRTVAEGERVDYTIDVANHGPNPAQRVVVTDPLPAQITLTSADPSTGACDLSGGVLTCALGTIADGDHVTITLHTTATDAGTPLNAAETTSPTFDPHPGDDYDSVGVTSVRHVDLSLGKTGSDSAVVVGSSVTYTLHVRNRSDRPSAGAVVTDSLPDGLTVDQVTSSQGSCAGAPVLSCDLGSIAAGQDATVTITATVTAAGQLGNSASIVGRDDDPDPSNNLDTTMLQAGDRADLEITKSTPLDTVSAGQRFSYAIVVTNHGPSSAPQATITDPIPNGVTIDSTSASSGGCSVAAQMLTCNIGTLADGAAATVAVVAHADGTQSTRNVSQVVSPMPDPVIGDNRSQTATTRARANLTVSKSATPAATTVGHEVRFRIAVRNLSATAATGVLVSDPLAPGVEVRRVDGDGARCRQMRGSVDCRIARLGGHRSRTIAVLASVSRPGTIDNRSGVVSAYPSDPRRTNDIAGTQVRVGDGRARLALAKRASRHVTTAPGLLRYRIVVRNAGTWTAHHVHVCDALPDGLAFVDHPGARLAGGAACWPVGTLTAGSSRTLRLTARALAGPSGPIVNRARATTTNGATRTAASTVERRGSRTRHRGGGVTG